MKTITSSSRSLKPITIPYLFSSQHHHPSSPLTTKPIHQTQTLQPPTHTMSYTPPYTPRYTLLPTPQPEPELETLTIGWRAKKSTTCNIIENSFHILFWTVLVVAGASLLVAGVVFVYDVVVMARRDYILGSSHTLEAAGEGMKASGTRTASAALVG